LSTPYRTLDDVVAGLAALEARFRARGDRRSMFLTLYGVVSAEMRDRVADRQFEDNAWVHRYAVAFANLYREAQEAYDAGNLQQVPKAWRLCFDAARAGTGLVLSDVLLGVNAHVNHDLPYALNGISIEPDRQKRYRDHAAVNAVLGAVTEGATLRLSSLYAPGLSGLDTAAGGLDEMMGAFSLEVARESAWESAVSLANARGDLERTRAMTQIGIRAALVARLLLSPVMHPPVVLACRRIEDGGAWVRFVSAINGARS
jgi:hypothetical protein